MGDWNLGTFITFILIFIIAILAIVYNVSKIGGTFATNDDKKPNEVIETPSTTKPTTTTNTTTATTYSELEAKVEAATKVYVGKYYPNLSQGDNFVILVSSLINNGNLNPIVDIKNASVKCDGYTIVYNDGAAITYNSFIKCDKNYTTSGYDSRYN